MIKKLLKLTLALVLTAGSTFSFAQEKPLPDLKPFGSIGKELTVLQKDKETVLFSREGKGVLTHMWFGGDFKGYEQTKIKVYIDGEVVPSIDMELFLGHGIGFNDNNAPWAVTKIGKTGSPSGIYNTFRIPFGKDIKVTAQLGSESPDNPLFWWIIRGTENLPIMLGDVKLPEKARLKLYKMENKELEPLTEFDLCNVQGGGAVFMVTMAAKGLRIHQNVNDRWKDLSYQEGCVRAYLNNEKEPLMISSGLEDYFLGTYYFNKGKYYSDIAGLTHFDEKANEFSAYRFHDQDPIFFQKGLRLTGRVGEKIGEKIFHDPPKTRYTTYVWLYQW